PHGVTLEASILRCGAESKPALSRVAGPKGFRYDGLAVKQTSGGNTMTHTFSVAVPLFDDGQGGLRVTGTRVLLERIVHAFEDGATPEGIVQSYDTLDLADVYAVLTWYLQHKVEVETYLRDRAEKAQEIRRAIEATQTDRS